MPRPTKILKFSNRLFSLDVLAGLRWLSSPEASGAKAHGYENVNVGAEAPTS
jgi:hypothetical protein